MKMASAVASAFRSVFSPDPDMGVIKTLAKTADQVEKAAARVATSSDRFHDTMKKMTERLQNGGSPKKTK